MSFFEAIGIAVVVVIALFVLGVVLIALRLYGIIK